jgi:hypothetical protein
MWHIVAQVYMWVGRVMHQIQRTCIEMFDDMYGMAPLDDCAS